MREVILTTCGFLTTMFGRLPISEAADGRDHNRHAFSLLIAVGGLHATLLHALGLDHRRLTFPHDGRNDSLTDADVTHARIIPELLA